MFKTNMKLNEIKKYNKCLIIFKHLRGTDCSCTVVHVITTHPVHSHSPVSGLQSTVHTLPRAVTLVEHVLYYCTPLLTGKGQRSLYGRVNICSRSWLLIRCRSQNQRVKDSGTDKCPCFYFFFIKCPSVMGVSSVSLTHPHPPPSLSMSLCLPTHHRLSLSLSLSPSSPCSRFLPLADTRRNPPLTLKLGLKDVMMRLQDQLYPRT